VTSRRTKDLWPWVISVVDAENEGMAGQAAGRARYETEQGQPDTDGAGLLVLDREQCLELLAPGGLGRIAINVGALPAILPVRFALESDRIVLCIAAGSTLDRATQGAVVAFEADESGADGEWSVMVTGVARVLTQVAELKRAEALALPHWSNGGSRFIAISTDHISGRRSFT
jgi:nitroimidazol reductase NimA-like FMN-containing flavoprotein (pyridoxamine 5'-phosphate oxidase superfamily)